MARRKRLRNGRNVLVAQFDDARKTMTLKIDNGEPFDIFTDNDAGPGIGFDLGEEPDGTPIIVYSIYGSTSNPVVMRATAGDGYVTWQKL